MVRRLLLLALVLLTACAQKSRLEVIVAYLNASSVDEKGRYMADDFLSYFGDTIGAGDDKSASLADFLKWDGPLHPQVSILDSEKNGDVWLVHFNEQNDFSRGIHYPGWKGGMRITFNEEGKIRQTVYLPDTTNPSYRPWLQPALAWMEANHPADLAMIYQDGHLIKTETSAVKWRELLDQWNAQNGADH